MFIILHTAIKIIKDDYNRNNNTVNSEENSVYEVDLDPNINFNNINNANSIFHNAIEISNKETEKERKLLKLIADKNIDLYHHSNEKQKEDNGSLYKLFDSEFFDMHYINYYFHTKDDQGIIDTLVNQLYKRFTNESFFYLPQLWYFFNNDITFKL